MVCCVGWQTLVYRFSLQNPVIVRFAVWIEVFLEHISSYKLGTITNNFYKGLAQLASRCRFLAMLCREGHWNLKWLRGQDFGKTLTCNEGYPKMKQHLRSFNTLDYTYHNTNFYYTEYSIYCEFISTMGSYICLSYFHPFQHIFIHIDKFYPFFIHCSSDLPTLL
jgi:hypothetical protein